MLLAIYRILMVLPLPFLLIYLFWRCVRGQDPLFALPQRFGFPSRPRPKGRLIWLHAASVGEVNSIVPLIKYISSKTNEFHFLVTTVNSEARTELLKRKIKGVVHQFLPIDSWPCLKLFLWYWHPEDIMFVESELWPETIIQARNKCKGTMTLLNARMSESTLLRWKKYAANTLARLLDCFDHVMPWAKQTCSTWEMCGAKNVRYLGNLKYAAPPLVAVQSDLEELQDSIKERTVWGCASVHGGEIIDVIEAHLLIAKQLPGLITIIAPRHCTVGEQIAIEAQRRGLKTATRSKGELPGADCDLYIMDTMGELGLLYRVTPVVFIGGSLIPHGGQNVLEAIRLGAAVIVGPHTANFSEIIAALVEKKGIEIIKDYEHLANQVINLHLNPQNIQNILDGAAMFAEQQDEVLHAVYAIIKPNA